MGAAAPGRTDILSQRRLSADTDRREKHTFEKEGREVVLAEANFLTHGEMIFTN